MYKAEFQKFIYETNKDGSGKADSYIRALDMLGPILTQYYPEPIINGTMWQGFSPTQLTQIRQWILDEGKKSKYEDTELLKAFPYKSYLQDNFSSAAIGAYREFIIVEGLTQQISDEVLKSKTSIRATQKAKAEIVSSEKILLNTFKTKEGKERLQFVRTRVNQDVFRKIVLKNYNGKCCLTGLSIPEVLRASHISAWSDDEKNRFNPENGLCLSATYDAAFDRHLISFDEDYRLILSKRLKEFYTDDVSKQWFHKREGQRIELPVKFLPSQQLLQKHREELLA